MDGGRRLPAVIAWAWTTGYDSPLVDVTPGLTFGEELDTELFALPDDLAARVTAWVETAEVLGKRIQDDEPETPASRRAEQDHAQEERYLLAEPRRHLGDTVEVRG